MIHFVDTEFIEAGPYEPLRLLSIGILAEDGREYYSQVVDVNYAAAGDWVVENVFSQFRTCPTHPSRLLPGLDLAQREKAEHQNGRCRNDCPWDLRTNIAPSIVAFCDPQRYGKPRFVTYYGSYDHVALCQLFGTMVQLPKGFPMWTFDIKQWADSLGNPALPRQTSHAHNALDDARHNQVMWQFLKDYERKMTDVR